MDVVRVEVVEDVIWAQLLAPVVSEAAHLTLKALVQPQRDVVAAFLAAGARADALGVVEVRAAVAANIALGHTIGAGGGVDVEAGCRALDEALVLDGIADGLDVQLGEREALEANEHVEPLLHRALECGGDLGAVGGSALVGIGVPTDAVVDAAVVGHELVDDPVLVLETIGVLLHSLLPDLVKASDHGGGRVPSLSLSDGGARSQVAGEDGLGGLVGAEALLVANVLDGRVCQRTHSKGRSGNKLKLDHGEVENE